MRVANPPSKMRGRLASGSLLQDFEDLGRWPLAEFNKPPANGRSGVPLGMVCNVSVTGRRLRLGMA